MIVDEHGNDYFVFDGHVHVGWRPFTSTVTADRGDGGFFADELIANMDAAGVDMAVIFPRANPHTDYSTENERMIQAAREHPDRLIPYVRVQPFFGKQAADDVARFGELGARGVKIHPFMDFAGNAVNRPELTHDIVKAAASRNMLVLTHSGESWNAHPALVWDLARAIPQATIIMAHCGLWEGHQSAIALAKETPNLFMDTSEVSPPAVIWNVVKGIGADRLLFGSDHPAIPYGWEIGKVVKYAGLAPDDIRKIIGLNLAGLLGVDASKPRGPKVELRDI